MVQYPDDAATAGVFAGDTAVDPKAFCASFFTCAADVFVVFGHTQLPPRWLTAFPHSGSADAAVK